MSCMGDALLNCTRKQTVAFTGGYVCIVKCLRRQGGGGGAKSVICTGEPQLIRVVVPQSISQSVPQSVCRPETCEGREPRGAACPAAI